eukprot:5315569-Prymnesium_polylepis.2
MLQRAVLVALVAASCYLPTAECYQLPNMPSISRRHASAAIAGALLGAPIATYSTQELLLAKQGGARTVSSLDIRSDVNPGARDA